jgi:hypothetical protein
MTKLLSRDDGVKTNQHFILRRHLSTGNAQPSANLVDNWCIKHLFESKTTNKNAASYKAALPF